MSTTPTTTHHLTIYVVVSDPVEAERMLDYPADLEAALKARLSEVYLDEVGGALPLTSLRVIGADVEDAS